MAAEVAARQETAHTAELRDLVAELLKPALSFEPATIRKATVTAVSPSSTPPTISIRMSGDTTTTISGVRIEETYSPRVGHTVLVFKQGNEIFAFGHIADLAGASAGGWTTPSLAGGWSHNGNSNGNVQYRRVMDNGSWKMQWRGGGNYGGSTVLASALAAEFRPASRRTCVASRDANGSNVVKVDFETSGAVNIVGGTTSPSGGSGGGGGTGFDGSFSVGSHFHSIPTGSSGNAGGFSIGSHNHSTSSHSHSISVDSPNWVSFNGIEYFL